VKELISFALHHIKKHKKFYIISLLIIIFTTALQLPVPFFFKNMIDRAVYQRNLNSFHLYIIAIISILFLREGGRLISNITMEKAVINIVKKIKVLTLKRFLSNALYPYEKEGYVVSRTYDEPDDLREVFFEAFVIIIKSVMLFIFGLVALIFLSWRLTLTLLLFLPLYIYMTGKMKDTLHKSVKPVIEENAKARSLWTNIAGMVEEYKIFDKKGILPEKAYLGVEKVMNKYFGYAKHAYFYDVIMNSLNDIIPIVTTLLGIHEIFKGRLTAGGLFAFTSMQGYLLNPIQSIMNLRINLVQSYTVFKRLSEFYTEDIPVTVKSQAKDDPVLTVKGLNISFENCQILEDISLSIYRGDKVLLIGDNGTGKTTFLRAMLGFLKEYKGEIYSSIPPYIGYSALLDTSQLIEGTIIENITFGDPEDAGRLEQILRITNLKPVIKKYSLNYHVDIAGKNLSQGERQKILLARTLYKKADIYILDEPIQHIPQDEAVFIYKNMLEFLKNKTVISVMHITKGLEDLHNKIYNIQKKKLTPLKEEV